MNFRHTMVKFVYIYVLFSLMFDYAASDDAKDKQDCTNSLVGLATCLPYVGGNSKAPTPDCCTGLKQVINTNKKCLCLVIKDRNDPDLGLNINVTLALSLPTVCHAPANITKCPELLHLDPKSPDAQIFYQYGHDSSTISASPASSPSSNVGSSPTSSPTLGPSAQQKNDGCKSGNTLLGIKATAITILILLSSLA